MRPMKRCTKCQQEFPATEEYFYLFKQGKYGLYPTCKVCFREIGRKLHFAPLNDPNVLKVCTCCKQSFPATQEFFHLKKTQTSGLHNQCKNCRKTEGKKYYKKPINNADLLIECVDCHIHYPATTEYFYASRTRRYGLNDRCKSCFRMYAKQFYKAPIENPSLFLECKRCNILLPTTTEFFYAKKDGRFGLRTICISCWHQDISKYYYENRDRMILYSREYDEAHREERREYGKKYRILNREKELIRKRIYREEKREVLRARGREYSARNRHKIRDYQRKWRKENPLKIVVRDQKRRASIRGLPNTLTEVEWQKALEYWNYCCAYCGTGPNKLTLEHFIPVSNTLCPGTVATNVIPACSTCNFSKGNRNSWLWLKRRFGEEKAEEIAITIHMYFSVISK